MSLLKSSVKGVIGKNSRYKSTQIKLDFSEIIGNQVPQQKACLIYETEMLKKYLKRPYEEREEYFKDPVVQLFLHLKWKKVRPILWMSIAFYVLWLILFSIFVLHLYLIMCPYDIDFGTEEAPTETAVTVTTEDTPGSVADEKHGLGATHMECVYHDKTYLLMEISLLYILSAFVVAKELYEISVERYKYLQWENLGQWIQVGLIIFTAIPVYSAGSSEIMLIHRWQYQAAAYGIFLAWALILLEVGKLPKLQAYIEMLGKGLQRFLIFLVTFISLFVAFVFAFSILLPEKHAFIKWPWNIVKILTMMAGEVNYDDLFYGDNTTDEVPFFQSTKFFIAGFVVVVGIVLFNILVGLTVTDIQEFKVDALVSGLSDAVGRIHMLEKFLFSERNKTILNWVGQHIFRKTSGEGWDVLWYFRISHREKNNPTNILTTVDIKLKDIPKDLRVHFHKCIEDWQATQEGKTDVLREGDEDDTDV